MALQSSDPESSAVGRWLAPQQTEEVQALPAKQELWGSSGQEGTDTDMDKSTAQPASEAHFIVSNTKEVLISSKDFSVCKAFGL